MPLEPLKYERISKYYIPLIFDQGGGGGGSGGGGGGSGGGGGGTDHGGNGQDISPVWVDHYVYGDWDTDIYFVPAYENTPLAYQATVNVMGSHLITDIDLEYLKIKIATLIEELIQQIEIPCPICGEIFHSQAELEAHTINVHPPGATIPCPICGNLFYTNAELDAHVLTAHPVTPGPTIISAEYINASSDTDTEIKAVIAQFAKQGFKEFTVRVNSMYNWNNENNWDSDAASVRKVVQFAELSGLAVNVDFHTWQTTWNTYFRESVREGLGNQINYIIYIHNMLYKLREVPVKAYMLLNEPGTAKATDRENQFILNLINESKLETNKPMSIRFQGGYSPGTGHYSSEIDRKTDFLARNVYWDPANPGTSVYGVSQATMTKMKADAVALGKELWITEFGRRYSSGTQQKYIRDFVSYAKTAKIDRIYAWAVQVSSGEVYNLFDGLNPLPSFYELK